jgi:hypothetical protein
MMYIQDHQRVSGIGHLWKMTKATHSLSHSLTLHELEIYIRLYFKTVMGDL